MDGDPPTTDGVPSVNYFTCTLAEAAQRKHNNEHSANTFNNVLDLIDRQATKVPTAPAVGFANFKSVKSPQSDFLNFRQLYDLSWKAAGVLSHELGGWQDPISPVPGNIALLSTSDIDFILTWLGLMRLGYSVLLVAPQLGSDAVSSLCATLDIEIMLVKNQLQSTTLAIESQIRILGLPDYENLSPGDSLPFENLLNTSKAQVALSDIAYFCHTSGTSSSRPKPIPQLHAGVVGALCGLPENSGMATFSTTPLYHGGLPDCFRAWTSGAMVWFFPEGFAPVTSGNILKAIKRADQTPTGTSIRFFSSVPYVLQMLAEEDEGLKMLQDMDLVGAGGAALPTLTGDKLVMSGVNLVSRLGSAECGFLMSSHRDYAKDKEWEYLRPAQDSSLIQFERRDDGLSELIVKSSWPCLVKRNREDGSYATADLFEPHSSIANAWRYHSRADAQITLSNGKKFDPSPIEALILDSTKLLRDVFIFGSERNYPGALLFPKQGNLTDQEILDSTWPLVDEMNSTTQSHARLSKSMLRVVSVPEGEQPLEKSSKGTILRGRANEKYDAIIDATYSGEGALPPSPREDGHSDLYSIVTNCFYSTLGRQINPEVDFYQQGVDSIACIRIRKAIESSLPSSHPPLPLNIIYDTGTIKGLIDYLRQDSAITAESLNGKSTADTMRALVEKYSHFESLDLNATGGYGDGKKRRTVVLTGATGFLGAHVLHLLRQDEHVDMICCLVRAETASQGGERVQQALMRLQLPLLDENLEADSTCPRIMFMPWKPGCARMGLSEKDMTLLISAQPSVVIHSAWAVNFALNVESFENQIAGTHDLIQKAATVGARVIFVSSTAAVLNSTARIVREETSSDPGDASLLGYSQSKWVTEQICVAAQKYLTQVAAERPGSRPMEDFIAIIRIGQLCADQTGVWNMSEAFPLMLSTAGITGCLPDLPGESLSWLPVDQAALAVVEAAMMHFDSTNSTCTGDLGVCELKSEQTKGVQFFHVLNTHQKPTWHQFLQWIQGETDSRGFNIELVKPSSWVQRLRQAIQERFPNHPSQALLGMWEERFAGDDSSFKNRISEKAVPAFDMAQTEISLQSMKGVKPLNKDRLMRIWHWVQCECARRDVEEAPGAGL